MARTHTTGRPQVILYNLVFLLGLGLGTTRGGAGETPRKGGILRVAAFFTRVEAVQPLDTYTAQIRLTEKLAIVLPALTEAAMYPKEVLDEAGDGPVKTFIGTGPFTIAEYQPDRFVKLVRFEQYQARPEPPNGYGGEKTAWVDTLRLVFFPDDATRLAAFEAGQVG